MPQKESENWNGKKNGRWNGQCISGKKYNLHNEVRAQ